MHKNDLCRKYNEVEQRIKSMDNPTTTIKYWGKNNTAKIEIQ